MIVGSLRFGAVVVERCAGCTVIIATRMLLQHRRFRKGISLLEKESNDT